MRFFLFSVLSTENKKLLIFAFFASRRWDIYFSCSSCYPVRIFFKRLKCYIKSVVTDCRIHSASRSQDTARLLRCMTCPIYFHTCSPGIYWNHICIASKKAGFCRSNGTCFLLLCVVSPCMKIVYVQRQSCSIIVTVQRFRVQRFRVHWKPACHLSGRGELLNLWTLTIYVYAYKPLYYSKE